jgi:ABC-type arginine/histidine transport system permease subunit
MDNVLYTFKVHDRKIKATFIVVSLSIFLCFSILRVIGHMLGRPDSTVIDTLFVGLPLGVFIFLWIYGKYRMFGFEWQLCDQGLRILRYGQEIRFIPWKDIADTENG